MRKNLLLFAVFMFASVLLFAQLREDVVILEEGFEGLAFEEVPEGWTQIEEDDESDRLWGAKESSFSMNVTPHSGSMLMDYWAGDITKFVTPSLDLSESDAAGLHFFYSLSNAGFPPVNQLKVYYRSSAEGEWVELAYYTEEIIWDEITLDLVDLSADYYIAFEGICNNSFNDGVQLDDITITQYEITSIDSYESEISIYPNPSNGLFTIENLQALEIIDINGRIINQFNNLTANQSNSLTVDISNQPKGIYFLKIKSQGGKSFSKKLIVN